MDEFMVKRKYITFDLAKGWPAAEDLFYECLKCGTIISSIEDGECLCHNLYVDASAGRMGADDPNKVRLFRIIAKN